jgi:hypothetical protein
LSLREKYSINANPLTPPVECEPIILLPMDPAPPISLPKNQVSSLSIINACTGHPLMEPFFPTNY